MARWPPCLAGFVGMLSQRGGQHDIPQDGRQGQIGQEPVQHGLRGRLIESVRGLPEPGGGLTPCGRGEARPGEIAKGGTRIAAERGACRLGVQPEAAWVSAPAAAGRSDSPRPGAHGR